MTDANSQSVCLNHPDVPATGRCSVCRKPICDACTVMSRGQRFCSYECMADAQRTGAKVEAIEQGKARGDRRIQMRRAGAVIVLVILAAAGWYLYANHKDKVAEEMKELQRKAVELQGEGRGK